MNLLLMLSLALVPGDRWQTLPGKGFTLYFQAGDAAGVNDYRQLFKKGRQEVLAFFPRKFRAAFSVYIHPDRASLDSTWSHDWKMPGFRSECWMVASGISGRVDLIAPKQWKTQSCEHDASDQRATQQLITHELFHVYHAQMNRDKDFSSVEGLDWFAEGLAAYASGQLTPEKHDRVRKAFLENKLPDSLSRFWTGPLRYPLSASVVAYIDQQWGRKKLLELLAVTSLKELLESLAVSEKELLAGWRTFLNPKKMD